MKKVFLIHGWAGSPNEPLHKWIKEKLEEKVYQVTIPEMPNSETPTIESWLGKLTEIAKDINEETIFIGHSIGCQAILRFLEKLPENVKIGKCILIAPWMHLDEKTIEEEGEEAVKIAKPWIETPIDFEKVKTHCDKFTCIFSDNDQYVPLSDMGIFKQKLGAETILLNNKGHFDQHSGTKDLPEILEIIK